MKYKIITTHCECHPETCCHWRYVVTSADGTICGFDVLWDAKEWIKNNTKEYID